jgi:hypothetical protein
MSGVYPTKHLRWPPGLRDEVLAVRLRYAPRQPKLRLKLRWPPGMQAEFFRAVRYTKGKGKESMTPAEAWAFTQWQKKGHARAGFKKPGVAAAAARKQASEWPVRLRLDRR